MEETGNVKVLEKALTVLDTVQSATVPLGVNEIAKDSGLSPATAYRMLRTLKNHGYIYQDKNEKYTVGYKLSFVSEKTGFYMALKEVAYPVMATLSAQEKEAMNLAVRDPERCYILGQSRSGRMVDYVPPIGTTLPPHASACGKVLLSELSPSLLSAILTTLDFTGMTENTVTDKEQFQAVLAEVRKKGYALDNHETQDKGFCIAVPIRSAPTDTGEIIAALSFSGFIGQKSLGEVDYYVGLLQNASREITERLFGLQPLPPVPGID